MVPYSPLLLVQDTRVASVLWTSNLTGPSILRHLGAPFKGFSILSTAAPKVDSRYGPWSRPPFTEFVFFCLRSTSVVSAGNRDPPLATQPKVHPDFSAHSFLPGSTRVSASTFFPNDFLLQLFPRYRNWLAFVLTLCSQPTQDGAVMHSQK